MSKTEKWTFKYDPDQTYTYEEFEDINDRLKTQDVEIEGTPISHFELDAKGRLIPMPQTPIQKEIAVGAIHGLLDRWNIQAKQNGACTTSQGGFNLSTTGGKMIRAPDVAFTPREVYRSLTEQQLLTFRGEAFCPTFAVEVEDVSQGTKLSYLSNKFKDVYFPAGVQLGWLVDPINKKFYVFKKERGRVVRREKGWYDGNNNATVVDGGDVLPGFQLDLWDVDEAMSQVCCIILSY
jgi:Uma2 family endonuclease